MMASPVAAALELSLEDLAARATEPVEVAVIDSGIDATHPDLAGRIARAFRIEASEPVEVAVPSNNDGFGHGTGVASILARLAPNARLIDLRVLHPGNRGSGEDLIAGLRWAVGQRCRIVNMSLATAPRFAPQLVKLTEKAFYQDQVVVAAKRNVPISDDGLPAEFSSCIGVDTGRFASPFALRYRRRKTIEYQALGEQVQVAAAGGGYTTVSGTSFATPTVSAFCALLIGAFPELRPFEIRSILAAIGARQGEAD
jgi:subtilisin